MRVLQFILLFVSLHVRASIFNDFKGAMSSVENAFGKLLSDVVTDVKSTVHCTILAMEHVLAMNGVMPEPLPNNQCDDQNFDTETEHINGDTRDDFASQIHSSISRVNKTLSDILDNDNHPKMLDMKRVFKNESDHLIEVSNLLRQELEKISHRMRNKIELDDFNSDKASIESLWNDMKLLHEVEKTDKNTSEVREIGQVLNEALKLLHVNQNGVKSDEDKIQAIMLEVENEYKNKDYKNIHTITSEVSKWKSEQSGHQNNSSLYEPIPQRTPKNFKDVATKIFKNSVNITKEVNNIITDTSNSVSEKLLLKDISNTNQTKGPKLDDFSPLAVINNEDNIKAINEAMDVLKNGVETQVLLDEVFAKNKHGANVFDNPNLFDFNK